jgi:hypothetical protein
VAVVAVVAAPFHLRRTVAVVVAGSSLRSAVAAAAGASPTSDDLLMPLAYVAGLAGDPISKLRTTHACIASA